MGQASACCNSATLSANRGSINAGNDDVQLLRSVKEFKNDYIEHHKMCPTGKALEVVQKLSNQKYVLRKLPINMAPCKSAEDIGRHCQALEGLEHPHLCKFVEGFQDKNDVYLIYEKADAQTLFDYVKTEGKLKEQDAADYVRQVTMALKVAHSQKIYHGRLCASKIILALPMDDDEDDDNVQLKICDMGQVFILRPAPHEAPQTAKSLTTERYCVTPELAAGDLTSQQKPVYPAGVDKNDMWALGAIIYHLMTGSPPFQQCGDRQSLLDSVQNEVVEFTSAAWKKLSAEARDCVEMLLKINPSLRINAPTLLRHPWIQVAKTSFPKKRMVTLLKNLRLNADNCEFTRFVIRVIAEQLPTDGKQAETVESAYRCLDSDGDGILSVQELLKGLEKFLNLSQEEQKELFAMIDRDGSGTLNVSEFISATMDQRRAKSLPVLWQAFNAFDKDQGGSITFDEIDAIVMELEGALTSKEQVKDMCAQIRQELSMVSADETIDFDQFAYILQHNEPTKSGAFKRELFRFLWGSCKVDCYKVRHNKKDWDLSRVAMAASSRSAYRKKTRSPTKKTTQSMGKSGSEKMKGKGSPRTKEPAQAG